MHNHIPKIQAIHRALMRELFTIKASWHYSKVTQAIDLLARLVHDYEGDSDDWLYMGECDYAGMTELLVGAFWHYTEWYSGQWSPEYRALCNLGQVFSPGMTSGPEPGTSEKDVYLALDRLARKSHGMPVYRFELTIPK